MSLALLMLTPNAGKIPLSKLSSSWLLDDRDNVSSPFSWIFCFLQHSQQLFIKLPFPTMNAIPLCVRACVRVCACVGFSFGCWVWLVSPALKEELWTSPRPTSANKISCNLVIQENLPSHTENNITTARTWSKKR
jgi:hypothetical protein